jgi:hypothetical protein
LQKVANIRAITYKGLKCECLGFCMDSEGWCDSSAVKNEMRWVKEVGMGEMINSYKAIVKTNLFLITFAILLMYNKIHQFLSSKCDDHC